MTKTIALTFLASLSLLNTQVIADELIDSCNTCHGKDGNSTNENVPSIAGYSATYITDSLNAFKEGSRPAAKFKPENGTETDMGEVAKKMSDDDIAKVSAHYAKLTFNIVAQTVDTAKADSGREIFTKKCDNCHEKAGSVAEDDAGILLGQWKTYLEQQFKYIESGEREMPKKMMKRFKKLSAEDKANILEYLAGGKL